MSYQKIACQCPDAVYLLDMKGRSGVNNWCSGCKYKASWHFNAHFAPNFMQDKPESCLPNKEGNVRRWKESQLYYWRWKYGILFGLVHWSIVWMEVPPFLELLVKMMASVKIHSFWDVWELFYFRLKSSTGSANEYFSSAFHLWLIGE